MLRISCLVVLSLALAVTSAKASITFDLRDSAIEAIDGSDSMVLMNGGVTATLMAVVGAPAGNGDFNRTGTGFGINAAGGGDDTDQLDGANGIESAVISFNVDVLFDQLTLSVLSAGETGTLSLGSFTPIALSDTGSGVDVFNFATDNLLTAGQTATLSFASGNGFSFDSFTVATVSNVPEPVSLVVWSSLGGLGLLSVRSRRNRVA